MNWKFYIIWLIAYLSGVIFVYLLPENSLSTALRFAFLGVWGSVLGALFNMVNSKSQNAKATDTFETALNKKQPETTLIPVVSGKEINNDTPAFPKSYAEENSTPNLPQPTIDFPSTEWIDFNSNLLRNRPFPEVIHKLNDVLPKIFKNASGVLYMYSNTQTELHQIFAFGPNTISDPLIVPAECASFDSAKIVVADYSDPQHVNGCMHLHHRPQGYSFCAPIEGLEEHFGLLTIQADELPPGESVESWKTKISMVVTAFGLFVANQNLQVRFKTQSLRDQLTGLVNKRYMEEALTRAVSEARRHGTPIGMIMLHPDNFESMKNERGLHVVEQMLWELAQRLPRYIRTEDIPCRFSEDVLCILLPGADKIRTQKRAEKIRHEIENLQISYGNLLLQTTLSLGVSTFPENASDANGLIASAEHAMHEADALGQNRVCVSQSAPEKN